MVLVDANVLLDVMTDDPEWCDWSESRLAEIAEDGLAINPIIYAELTPGYRAPEDLDAALKGWSVERLLLPYDAAFPAGRAFVKYRQRGGVRRSPLPDFYIGAHAQVAGLTLLTRDGDRYREYFPDVSLICPES